MSHQKFLNTRDAAKFLGLSAYTLEAWRHRGGGPKFRKFGKAVRYADADLEAFVKASARDNTAQVAA